MGVRGACVWRQAAGGCWRAGPRLSWGPGSQRHSALPPALLPGHHNLPYCPRGMLPLPPPLPHTHNAQPAGRPRCPHLPLARQPRLARCADPDGAVRVGQRQRQARGVAPREAHLQHGSLYAGWRQQRGERGAAAAGRPAGRTQLGASLAGTRGRLSCRPTFSKRSLSSPTSRPSSPHTNSTPPSKNCSSLLLRGGGGGGGGGEPGQGTATVSGRTGAKPEQRPRWLGHSIAVAFRTWGQGGAHCSPAISCSLHT